MMANTTASLSTEEQKDPFSNLPDITKYSRAERDELLRRLIEYKKQQNEYDDPLINTDSNGSILLQSPEANNTNPNQQIIDKKQSGLEYSYYISSYQSKYVVLWFCVAIFGSFLFTSYNYICMTYQHNEYCKDPSLDDAKSWISFSATLIITIYFLSKLTHSILTSYQLAKSALNNTDNKFIKGDENDDYEIYVKFKKIGKWLLGFYLTSLVLLFLLYYLVLLFASFRDTNALIFEDPQSVIYLIRTSIGIIIFFVIYFPIMSFILSLFLYQRFCNALYDLATAYQSGNSYDPIEYKRKLIKFRNTLCNLKLFLLYIPSFGPYIIVLLWNWQFSMVMNLTFGQWNNGMYVYTIFSLAVGVISLALYALSRKKLSDYIDDILELCISRKVAPTTTDLFENINMDNDNNGNIHSNYINIKEGNDEHNALNINNAMAGHGHNEDEDASNWKLFRLKQWPKINKWCTNSHSVATIFVCIALINYINSDYNGFVGQWALNLIISWTILVSCGYLVAQFCSKDVHHRISVLYKSWLMIIKIFLIRRCKFIIDNDRAENPNAFITIQVLFTLLTVFGIIIFLMMTTKFELIYFYNSKQTKVVLSRLFPGYLEFELNFCNVAVKYIGIHKWKLLRLSFCGSIIMIFGSVIWCIVWANSVSNVAFQLKYLYIFVWVVPQLCLQNEIVQYMRLHLEWNKLMNEINQSQEKNSEMDKEKSKLNNEFIISMSSLQLLHPVAILSCLLSFIYLVIFGQDLGTTPVIFCGIQLFVNNPLTFVTLWQSS